MKTPTCDDPDHVRALNQLREGRCTGRTSRMLRDVIIAVLASHPTGSKAHPMRQILPRFLVVAPFGHLATTMRAQTSRIASEFGVAHVMRHIHFTSARKLEGGYLDSLPGVRLFVDHSVYDLASQFPRLKLAIDAIEEHERDPDRRGVVAWLG